jgi:formylglycine-generating enzyme required for sulfatase activity
VEDCWHESYESAPTDGSAWKKESGGNCATRVLRGGSWFNEGWNLRSSIRIWGVLEARENYIGFRLVQDTN